MRQVGGWRSVCYYLDTAAECGEASGLDQAVAEDQQTSSTRPPPPAFCPVGLSNNTDYQQPTGQSDNF